MVPGVPLPFLLPWLRWHCWSARIRSSPRD